MNAIMKTTKSGTQSVPAPPKFVSTRIRMIA